MHLREEALHVLRLKQDPVRAVELAARNWNSQREPADARLLMTCAIAAGRPAAAEPVLDWMRRTGIEDADLHALRERIGSLR